jgi:ABC-type branched-subunit amino acid transport system substrate-binding protein
VPKADIQKSATFTRAIITGTSIKGPITAAKATPLLIPNIATATAIANTKLLLAAVEQSDLFKSDLERLQQMDNRPDTQMCC